MHKSSMNKVVLVGNLGKDPERRATSSGNAVANFSLATTETFTNNKGESTDKTEWHNCVAFGRTAEVICEYASKGRKVYVEGRIRTEKWTDKNNQDRWTTKIYADQFILLDFVIKDAKGAPAGGPIKRSDNKEANTPPWGEPLSDSNDLPF